MIGCVGVLQGGESLIPGLQVAFREAHRQGVEFIEMGTSHRGRLNILHNIMKQSMSSICRELDKSTQAVEGDLQIHIGRATELQMGETDSDAKIYNCMHQTHESEQGTVGNVLRVSMSPNPAHLEAVSPVVLGRARARQFYAGDKRGVSVLPVCTILPKREL